LFKKMKEKTTKRRRKRGLSLAVLLTPPLALPAVLPVALLHFGLDG